MARGKPITEIDTTAFYAALERAAGELDRDAKKEMRKLGGKVRTSIRQKTPRQTGALRKSIRTKSGKDERGYFVQIYTTKFYGKFLEFGTSKMSPRPFFRPAISEAPGMFRRQQVGGADPGIDG